MTDEAAPAPESAPETAGQPQQEAAAPTPRMVGMAALPGVTQEYVETTGPASDAPSEDVQNSVGRDQGGRFKAKPIPDSKPAGTAPVEPIHPDFVPVEVSGAKFETKEALARFVAQSRVQGKQAKELTESSRQLREAFERVQKERDEAVSRLSGAPQQPQAQPQQEQGEETEDPMLAGINWEGIAALPDDAQGKVMAIQHALHVMAKNSRKMIAEEASRIVAERAGPLLQEREAQQQIGVVKQMWLNLAEETLEGGDRVFPELLDPNTTRDIIETVYAKLPPEQQVTPEGIEFAILKYRSRHPRHQQAAPQIQAPAFKAAPRIQAKPAAPDMLTGTGTPRPAPQGLDNEKERLKRELSGSGEARTLSGMSLGFHR